MTNYLRGYCERAAAQDGEAGSPIRFTASTENVGRDGLILEARGWQLDEFKANPTILWSHDYAGQRPPIGRAVDVWIDGDRLMADIQFDSEFDEFARSVEGKYRRGVLSSVSVGWDTVESDGRRSLKHTLLDISAVNIPGDPSALMERQIRAAADLGQKMAELLEPETSQTTHDAEALWVGTAYQMVRLFRRDANDEESKRWQDYMRLVRSYERIGKTAPEFLGSAELAALDDTTWRGLFLAGEAETVPELFEVRVQPEDDWFARAATAYTGATR